MRMGAGSFEQAVDVDNEQADRLIAYDDEFRFEQAELVANLIAIKVSQMFGEKEIDYPRPSAEPDKDKKRPAVKGAPPLTDAIVDELVNMTN